MIQTRILVTPGQSREDQVAAAYIPGETKAVVDFLSSSLRRLPAVSGALFGLWDTELSKVISEMCEHCSIATLPNAARNNQTAFNNPGVRSSDRASSASSVLLSGAIYPKQILP
ncbi:hypothetical protein NQZ68_001305 [Dissostichus eleginoides]|nr:hypothetical protein NQZ68_001305 [Dissostichus eleginoides]